MAWSRLVAELALKVIVLGAPDRRERTGGRHYPPCRRYGQMPGGAMAPSNGLRFGDVECRVRAGCQAAPMSVLELRSRIDLPVASTVFCFFSPHITWMEMLHAGKSA